MPTLPASYFRYLHRSLHFTPTPVRHAFRTRASDDANPSYVGGAYRAVVMLRNDVNTLFKERKE